MSSLSVNGQARVPPGFRFHPTEEELLNYYLRKKVACEKIDLDVIRDVDLNKLEPWDIQEKCRIGSTPQNDWYFFSHKDKKYPTGTRTNRATAAGFWKATGRDKVIYSNFKRIGMRKTLVFYKGRAPHGQKSDWIMHEYRLEDHSSDNIINSQSSIAGAGGGGVESSQEEGWVVCRVFKKKNHHKAIDSPNNSSSVTSGDVMMNGGAGQMLQYSSTSNGGDGALDQILQYMGRTCKQEREPSSNKGLRFLGREMLADTSTTTTTTTHERFMQLPPLESPGSTVVVPPAAHTQHGGRYTAPDHVQIGHYSDNINIINPLSIQYMSPDDQAAGTHHLGDWATLDRLVASHLNGGDEAAETSKQLASCFNGSDPSFSSFCSAASDSDIPFPSHLIRSSINNHNDDMADLWTFARSASSSSDHFPSCTTTTQTPLPN